MASPWLGAGAVSFAGHGNACHVVPQTQRAGKTRLTAGRRICEERHHAHIGSGSLLTRAHRLR